MVAGGAVLERANVVFAIEKSAAMKTHLPELLESYIKPAMSFFNGGVTDEADAFFTQLNSVQYAAVFYGTQISFLGAPSQLESYGPTTSEKEIIMAIQEAQYTCHNTTRQAFILDGLQAALRCFDVMKLKHPIGEPSQQYCIVITQSAPTTNPWSPYSPEKTRQEINANGVKVSVISAHKLVELYHLFDAAGGDHQAMANKNYASKPQHLVLLNGFTLQERAVSPSVASFPSLPPLPSVPTPPSAHGSITTTPAASVPPGPSPNPTQRSQTTPSPSYNNMSSASPAASQPGPQPVQMFSTRGTTPGLGGQLVNPGQVPGQTPMMPGIMSSGLRRPGDAVNLRGANSWVGQGPRPGAGVGLLHQQQSPSQLQPETTGASNMPGNPNIPPHMVAAGQGATPQNGSLNPVQQPQPQQQPQQAQQPRTVVWQGILEWHDKRTDGNARTTHQVQCKMTSQVINGEIEVKTDNWPPTLMMQMIPKPILSSMGNTFFKNVKTVMFMPEPCPALEVLTSVLTRGMAGCVHVSYNNAVQNEIKVLILLFSGEKKAYVGFIPNDQVAFVSKIRSVIQAQKMASNKQGQTMVMQGPGAQGVGTAGNQFTGMATGTGAGASMMAGPGASQMPGMPTNSGPGMNPNVMTTASSIIQRNPTLNLALSQPISQGGLSSSSNILGLAGGQMSQQMPADGSQGSAAVGQGPAMGGNVPSLLQGQLTRPPIQTMQAETDKLQLRQLMPMHFQQQQQQLGQRGTMGQVSGANMGQMVGSNVAGVMGQPRMMQQSNTGLRQLLQQGRLQQQQQQQQQQHQQPHMMILQQQQQQQQQQQIYK